MKTSFCGLFFWALVLSNVAAQTSLTTVNIPPRSLVEVFPNLQADQLNEIYGDAGFIRSYEKNEPLVLIPDAGSGIDIYDEILQQGYGFHVESLLVVPYPDGRSLSALDAYNAVNRIRDLKGRLYHSFTRQEYVPLFEDATRLESDTRNNPIPDPAPAQVIPAAETVFMRLKDINFGNSYYRGDFSKGRYGITYNLSNYRNISYLFFSVMKTGEFNAILYMEPIEEGMLVYSVAGANASNFIASMIDIPSAIEKRLTVFIGWISDGIITQ